MAAITPANLYVLSQGSNTLFVADMNTASNGDTWASGISDVVSAVVSGRTAVASGCAVSWTTTNGRFHFLGSAGRIQLWILAGNGNDMAG